MMRLIFWLFFVLPLRILVFPFRLFLIAPLKLLLVLVIPAGIVIFLTHQAIPAP